jgi:hypothetical protein
LVLRETFDFFGAGTVELGEADSDFEAGVIQFKNPRFGNLMPFLGEVSLR